MKIAATISELVQNKPQVTPPFDPAEFGRIAQSITSSINWADAEIYLKMTGENWELSYHGIILFHQYFLCFHIVYAFREHNALASYSANVG